MPVLTGVQLTQVGVALLCRAPRLVADRAGGSSGEAIDIGWGPGQPPRTAGFASVPCARSVDRTPVWDVEVLSAPSSLDDTDPARTRLKTVR